MFVIQSIPRYGQSKPRWILPRRNSSNPSKRLKNCLPCTKSLRNEPELSAIFISLADFYILLRRRSSRTIGCSVVLSVLCLTSCAQDSPPSSKERTVSVLLELLRDETPEMRRIAAECLGKIGDPRTGDSILPLIHDPAATVRAVSLLALGRVKPTATEGVVALL